MLGSVGHSGLDRKYIAGCRFLRDWLLQFKPQQQPKDGQQTESQQPMQDNDEDGEDEVKATLSSDQSPMTRPSFVNLIKQLFSAHLNAKSSVELICTLLEMVLAVSREHEWTAIFPTERDTTDLLHFIVSLGAPSSASAQPKTLAASPSTAALKAAQI